MTADTGTESLLRDLAPRALGAIVRRYGHFSDAEDSVQEALLAAATAWPVQGEPERPLAWLIAVAARRMTDQFRSDEARRRREDLAASWSASPPEVPSGQDDTLILLFMCCHPALSAPSAIALTLRAVGGLSTREIAAAFLVPEATMAQRISRAKATVAASAQTFALPAIPERDARLRSVLHVLYLLFNEGYTTSSGSDLLRAELSAEAIRLVRLVNHIVTDDPEVAGLLALMLLNDARRAARTGAGGALVPLADQDRARWDRARITEGVVVLTAALRQGRMGEYQAQAAIAALHDQAPSHETTRWSEILALYDQLGRISPGPMVSMNRAVAVAMVRGARRRPARPRGAATPTRSAPPLPCGAGASLGDGGKARCCPGRIHQRGRRHGQHGRTALPHHAGGAPRWAIAPAPVLRALAGVVPRRRRRSPKPCAVAPHSQPAVPYATASGARPMRPGRPSARRGEPDSARGGRR